MTEKKRRGSGQATRRKDGRWQASYVTNNGKRLYFYGDTQSEANKKRRQAELEDEKGYACHWSRYAFKYLLRNMA